MSPAEITELFFLLLIFLLSVVSDDIGLWASKLEGWKVVSRLCTAPLATL